MKPAIITAQPGSLLEEAQNQIYDFGCEDASDVLAKLNLQFGLGKIIWALKKRNLPTEKVLAVTTPDSGITRNKERWEAGFSYGCLLRWPSKSEAGRAFAFPQIKPNACGMLVAKLSSIPQYSEICSRLEAIKQNGLQIEQEKLKLNIGVSNHFIELCKVSQSNTSKLNEDDCLAVIHTSPSEYKALLYDFKAWEAKGGVWEDTPLGPLFVLEGSVAEEYFEAYKKVEEFSLQKRIILAKHLFGEFEVVSNPTHQGLFGDNEARLGLYRCDNNEDLFPITFRWNIPVYLVQAKPSLSPELLDENKVVSADLRNILGNLNMLPHGGGYEIPFEAYGWEIADHSGKRLFSYRDNDRHFVFSSAGELPYYYRGLKILNKVSELKLGSVAAELKQVYTLKY